MVVVLRRFWIFSEIQKSLTEVLVVLLLIYLLFALHLLGHFFITRFGVELLPLVLGLIVFLFGSEIFEIFFITVAFLFKLQLNVPYFSFLNLLFGHVKLFLDFGGAYFHHRSILRLNLLQSGLSFHLSLFEFLVVDVESESIETGFFEVEVNSI